MVMDIEAAIEAHLLSFKLSLDGALETISLDPAAKCGPFFNRTEAHASLLISAVFQSAQSHVDILAGRLSESVYDDCGVVNSAIDFLKRSEDVDQSRNGRKALNILLDRHDDKRLCLNDLSQRGELSLLKQLKERQLLSKVAIRAVSKETAEKYTYHFSLADAASYRFEVDKNRMDAIGYFGHTDDGETLQQRFSEIWDLSQNGELTDLMAI